MKKFLLVYFLFGFGLSAWAQERVISGKVTSAEDGGALPGVNVIQKGTTNGTVTDAEGMYKLTVNTPDGVLVFSFVGLTTQEIEIGSRTTIDIQLSSDVTQLSEVFVTAQGIERSKNELAYAAQKVNGDQLTRTRDPNFINALSGKVAGVQIQKTNSLGGSTNVVIRGYKSFLSNNQPLYVVDGVPIDNTSGGDQNTTRALNQQNGVGGYDYGNAAADINPDDIESLNVLKGAAATALYGVRGANGVILITTKKAKKGLGVTINTGVTMGKVDKTTLPSYQHEYGAGYGQYYGPDGDAYFDQADVNGDGVPDLVVPTYEDASQGGKFDPSLNVYQWDAFDPTSPNYGKATPWVAAKHDPTTFFTDSYSTNNNIAIDGASDRGSYKLNYTHTTDGGILPNAKVKKDFVNFSSSYNLTPKLTATAAINYTGVTGLGRYATGYDGASGRNVMTSFRQWYEMNVDVQDLKNAYNRAQTVYGVPKNMTWNYAGPPSNLKPIFWDNPYWVRYQNTENDSRNRYFGYAKLDYKITDWLDVMGRYSLDTYSEMQEEKIAVGSVGVAGYTRYNRTYQERNADFMANFKKNFSEAVTFRATLGANFRRTKWQSIQAATNGGLIVPFQYAVSNSANPPLAPAESYSDVEVDGVYGNASVGLKKFFFVDLSYRRDRSSTLPKDVNSYNYGSAAGSFVFSELMGPSPWLTIGKIRGNYAEVGNGAPFNVLRDQYDKPAPFGTSTLFSIPNTKNNSTLIPERTKSVEVGLEMAFFDNRVGFDATYYKTNTLNQNIPVSVSTSTGYSFKYINAGNMQNNGVELQLWGLPVKTNDFQWRIDLNWTRNRNKVLKIYTDAAGNELQNLQIGSYQGGVSTNAALGQPYGTLRGTDFVYDANGNKLVKDNGYYQISSASNVIIGNINPNWIAGLNNSFTYKSVTFSFLIDMKSGGSVFSTDMYYALATGLYKETAGLNELGHPLRDPVSEGGGFLNVGVKADGTPNTTRVEGDYYAQGYTNRPNKAFTYNAGYIKLREVALSWALPSSVVSKLGPIKGIDVSLIGRNLWIIKKYLPYADPEDSFGTGNAQGAQIGSLPNVKTTGFNVKFRF